MRLNYITVTLCMMLLLATSWNMMYFVISLNTLNLILAVLNALAFVINIPNIKKEGNDRR